MMGEYDYKQGDGTFVKCRTASEDPVRKCRFCFFDMEPEAFDVDGELLPDVIDDDAYEAANFGYWESGPFCHCSEKTDPYGGGAAACEGVGCGFYKPKLRAVK